MNSIKLFVLISICLIGCNRNSDSSSRTDLLPEPDLKERLAWQKAEVDSGKMTKTLVAKIYAKIPDVETPVEVLDLKWPKDIDEVYNVWFNSNKQIVCIASYPFSQTGDWDMGLTHYFDGDGNVYAFERNTSFYNSLCTEGLAIEQIVTYYNQNTMVDSIYVFTDVRGKTLHRDSCQFPYNYPYIVSKTSSELLKILHLKN